MHKSSPYIKAQISLTCPYCNHTGAHQSKGWRRCKFASAVRRRICSNCNRSFSERTHTIMHGLRSRPSEVISAIHARTEGVGLRATGRLVKRTHPTIASWEAKVQKLGEQLDCGAPVDYNVLLESDELYTKVGHNRASSQSTGWTACAIERNSRYCTKHVTGKRVEELFEKHTDVVLKFVGQANVQMVSDGEGRYASCLWRRKQVRTTLSGTKSGMRGRPKGSFSCLRKGVVIQRKVKGSQNKASRRNRYETPLPHHPESIFLEHSNIHANHSEAYNASLRRRCSAFRRRTNMYAKCNKGLDRALGTQRVIYNWVRPHFYHGETPGQSLGWAGEAITFEDFVKIRVA